jgi:hypothetical protein
MGEGSELHGGESQSDSSNRCCQIAFDSAGRRQLGAGATHDGGEIVTLREIFLSRFSPKLLALKAFVYQRQSSLRQLKENTGSTMYQRDLFEVAR